MARDWKSARREIEGRTCLVCGNPWVDPAHLWQRSRGGDESPENIVPLCREHHEAFDQHRLDLLPYLSYPKVAKVMELAAKWSQQRSNGMELARERLLPSAYDSLSRRDRPALPDMTATAEQWEGQYKAERHKRKAAEARADALAEALRRLVFVSANLDGGKQLLDALDFAQAALDKLGEDE